MNCFQKFVSLIFWATILMFEFLWHLLWIAFKSLYLWYSEQREKECQRYVSSCELLSKVCIFDILSNLMLDLTISTLVVNCFQKFVSLIFWATKPCDAYVGVQLWIAFKSLYLWYSEQQANWLLWRLSSCELLSKVCIFDILSNLTASNNILEVVVNCFQKFVSLIFWATPSIKGGPSHSLWIAFKSLYLWYSEQPLKEFISATKVVNCFQKFVSLIFWATLMAQMVDTAALWIAFKSLYLWYSEQL